MGFLKRIRLRLAFWLLSGLYDTLPHCIVSNGRVLTIEQDFSREELWRQRLQTCLDESPKNGKTLIHHEDGPSLISGRSWNFAKITAHTKRRLSCLQGEIATTSASQQPLLRAHAWATYRFWESLTRCTAANLTTVAADDQAAIEAMLLPFDDLARFAVAEYSC